MQVTTAHFVLGLYFQLVYNKCFTSVPAPSLSSPVSPFRHLRSFRGMLIRGLRQVNSLRGDLQDQWQTLLVAGQPSYKRAYRSTP